MDTTETPVIDENKPEDNPTDLKKSKTPVFRIGNSIFRTGLHSYHPGDLIEWVVPEGWNEKKYGKHFANYGPSISWEPLNAAAEKVLADHKAALVRKNTPQQSEIDKLRDLVMEQSKMVGELLKAFLAKSK